MAHRVPETIFMSLTTSVNRETLQQSGSSFNESKGFDPSVQLRWKNSAGELPWVNSRN